MSWSVWRVPGVSVQPEIVLIRWAVFEIGESRDRHFVGWSVTSREGRVSSPITKFDPWQRVGISRTGRQYQLIGPPGSDDDALWTFQDWLLINGSPAQVANISESIFTEIQAAQPRKA